jgi:hypothetical protein
VEASPASLGEEARGMSWNRGKLMGQAVNLLIPSGKHTENYGKSQFPMGKSTISMAIFNSYVKLPEGNPNHPKLDHLSIETLGFVEPP